MAKILISYYWPYKLLNGLSPTMCFYDGLRIGCQQRGHDVMEINHANFRYPIDSTLTKDAVMVGSKLEYKNNYIKIKIAEFKPDLIVAFNHTITETMYHITDCPVLVLDGDSPISNFWYNKHLMFKNLDRIKFGYNIFNHLEIYKNVFGVNEVNCFYIKLATSCVAQDLPIKRDIVFLGSIHGRSYNSKLISYINKISLNPYMKEKFIKVIKHAVVTADLSEIINNSEFPGLDFEMLFFYIAEIRRVHTLNILMNDFNFECFGWTGLSPNDPLYLHFNNDPVYKVIHNQNVYNTSKIAMSITQAQSNPNLEGYSWRVCDIMATNACLVTSLSSSIKQHFGKWVNIPMFSNAYEAYGICKKLTMNESWRKDIVKSSQLAIKEGKFTFYDRVSEIEEIFNLTPHLGKEDEFYEFYEFLCDKQVKHYDITNDSDLNEDIPFSINKRCKETIRSFMLKIYYLNLATLLKKLKLDQIIKRLIYAFGL